MAANSFCSSLSLPGIFLLPCIFCFFSCASSKVFDVSAKCPNLLTSANLTSGEARDDPSTLLVLVPWKVSFEQFVKFRPESCLLDGLSVQVFLQALRRMQQPPQYEFVLHGSSNELPSYDGMIDMLINKEVDAIVADITIAADRSERVAFTVPYLASSLVMITPFRYGSAGTLWDFWEPFSTPLWIALLGCFAVTGAALYLLEGQNPDFARTSKSREGGSSHGGSSSTQGQATLRANVAATNAPPSPSPSRLSPSLPTNPPLVEEAPTPPSHHHNPPPAVDTPIQDQVSHKRRIMNAYWFTSLCIFQAQQESVRTHLGRIVTVTWLFVMLIFNASYTASLASLLSAQKRYPTIDGFQALLRDKSISVGCRKGSFMKTYLDKLNLEGHTLKSFTSERDYVEALRAGNLKQDGVGALLEELPYMQILLQTECDLTQSSLEDDHLPSFGGFGFAFRKGNPLIDQFSKAILEMAEDGTLQILQNEWKIGDKRGRCESNSEPIHLRLRSFGGLFSIVACVYVSCLIWRLTTKAIKSPEGSCGPLIQALPCTQHGASIQRRGELSLGRRSNRVHDESQDDQIS
ncbi:hypothetical protein GOP47_0012738 [Adiantum capillus-veneris]|uniref:Ionotropic glutamate receptor C-terminal domain-containing protein n=1 Tax=Adiantum capillus-veneris TaxID=13818 RepID=A0A9D4URS6_ADICA|nr:hypothetical protein GOP47_0012738 [Adiantum capillus-veneris]